MLLSIFVNVVIAQFHLTLGTKPSPKLFVSTEGPAAWRLMRIWSSKCKPNTSRSNDFYDSRLDSRLENSRNCFSAPRTKKTSRMGSSGCPWFRPWQHCLRCCLSKSHKISDLICMRMDWWHPTAPEITSWERLVPLKALPSPTRSSKKTTAAPQRSTFHGSSYTARSVPIGPPRTSALNKSTWFKLGQGFLMLFCLCKKQSVLHLDAFSIDLFIFVLPLDHPQRRSYA